MRVSTPDVPTNPLLAISAHQVLARLVLVGGSMQKSQPMAAALPDPRRSSRVSNAFSGVPDFCFHMLSSSFMALALRRLG